jgi:hypothetical protein
MATEVPITPCLPESETQFTEHIITYSTDWYKYYQATHDFLKNHQHNQRELKSHITYLESRVTELEHQICTAGLKEIKLPTAVGPQPESYPKKLNLSDNEVSSTTATKGKDSASIQSMAPILAPGPKPGPVVGIATVHAALTSSAAIFVTPKPKRPVGNLADLGNLPIERGDPRQFVSRIHEQLVTNHDQYPCRQARMYYIISQLSGTPYSQFFPYIWDGICHFES